MTIQLRVFPCSKEKQHRKFSTCPKCGFTTTTTGTQPVGLPPGISATLLLNNTPVPQLLLNDSNVVVYANKAAARVLRVVQIEEAGAERSKSSAQAKMSDIPEANEDPLSIEARLFSGNLDTGEDDAQEDTLATGTGLEGHTIDQLNIELATKDMQQWLTLVQVFENVKISLRKREALKRNKDDYDAEILGEGPKYNYDYYGDLERSKHLSQANADTTLRERVHVWVTKKNVDETKLDACLHVNLIDPYATGYSFTAVTILPGGPEEHTFEDDEPEEKSGFNRPHLRKKNRRKKKEVQADKKVGNAADDMITRVRQIKDLILDEMDYSFIALSPDGDIVITNKATKAVLGAETLEASIGEGFEWIARLDIWRPDFSEPLPFEEWALNRLITHRVPVTQVIGLKIAGTYEVIVELRGKCLYKNPAKEEGLLAALAIVVDQTEWYKKEKAMQKDRIRHELFISNFSRELRSPVSGIVGLIELIYGSGNNLNDEQKNYIKELFRSVNSLLMVINDVLDFTKIEDGHIAVERNIFVLQDLVNELKNLFDESMSKDGVKFVLDLKDIEKSAFRDGTRLLCLGDDTKIRRVILNLLSNAFKFTTAGLVILRVSTEYVQRNNLFLRFEVTDTGIGISEENQAKIFAPFDEIINSASMDETLKSGEGAGVGFGLHISRHFVALLAGELGVKSKVGKGSTFWFTVPVGRPSPDSQPKFPPQFGALSSSVGLVMRASELQPAIDEDAHTEVESNLDAINIEGTVVLLVEDNWSHQLVMKKRLGTLGCIVETAVNGEQALTRLKDKTSEVDVIFTDLQMPLMGGIEMTKRIRKDGQLKHCRALPIIGVTATELKAERERALESGMDDLVVKPIGSEKSAELIRKHMDPLALGRRRMEGFPVPGLTRRSTGKS